jgi:hypothetical protein
MSTNYDKDVVQPIPQSLEQYFRTATNIGSLDYAISNNLYGINHRQIKSVLPTNKDIYGLTFITRPQLNLSSDNIRNNRLFYSLMSNRQLSLHRFIRNTLDPRLEYGLFPDSEGPIKCPLVDPEQVFIPILTNTLKSVSGWPDIVAPTFTSKQGVYREQYSQVDGPTVNYETFDLDLTFANMIGDPVIRIFYYWLHYMSSVFEGRMMPYLDFITENEIDYNTRIYRLVLDQSKRYVKKIAATGASFPISVPTGQFFDYTHEKPFNDQTKEFTVRMRCMGAIYNDDILVKSFNDAVGIFQPALRGSPVATGGFKGMREIPQELLLFFNNRGYPRIDPITMELKWYVTTDMMDSISSKTINEQTYNGGQ